MAEPQAPMTPVVLNKTTHIGLKIRQIGNTEHLQGSHFAKVTTQEFTRAGLDSPIIFIKDPQGQLNAAVMWGLDAGENLFVEDGKWTGGYVPSFVRSFPFAALPDADKPDHFYVGLFENSDYVNREEGELILNDDGSETEWFNSIKEFLIGVFQQDQLTREFIEKLDKLELLEPQSMTIKNPQTGETREKGGFFVVGKEKLANLSDEAYLELRKGGALEVIHAHLMSLHSLDRLVKRKEERDRKVTTTEPVVY